MDEEKKQQDEQQIENPYHTYPNPVPPEEAERIARLQKEEQQAKNETNNGQNPQGAPNQGNIPNQQPQQNGYNPNGYPQNGYNPNGYQQNGYNPNSYQQNGYNPNGYPQNGYNPNGYPPNQMPPYPPKKQESTGLGLVSLICGVMALSMSCVWWLCGILSVVSIVTGILQILRSKKRGLAIAGIVCSVIALLFAVTLILSVGAMIADENGREMLRQILNQYGYDL